MTKKLGLEQALCQGGTIDLNEGFCPGKGI